MPSGKREAAQAHLIAATAAAQPEEIRSRRTAAEETYQSVLNRLGAAGTYEVGGTGGANAQSLIGGSATDPSSFKQETVRGVGTHDIDRRYHDESGLQKVTKLDPTKATQNVEKSAQFRIMSRLTAESEQLLAREGDLYDEMLNNTQLPILEGAAAMARENADQLKRAFARGGSARRNAMQAVEQMRAKERVNSMKVQQVAERRFELDKWARENARTNLEFGQNWASNLGGVRESYNQAMDRASELMLTQALPIMFEAREKAYQHRNMAHAKNRERTGKWVNAILSVVSIAAGGMGGMIGMMASGAASAGAGAAAKNAAAARAGSGMVSRSAATAQAGGGAGQSSLIGRVGSGISGYLQENSGELVSSGIKGLISTAGTR